MDALSSDDPANVSTECPCPGARVAIVLPYAVSNVVFIERLPLLLYLGIGIPSGVFGGVRYLVTGDDDAWRMFVSAGILAVLSAAGLVVGNAVLWTWALRGYRLAVLVVYALYLPLAAWAVYFLATAFIDFLALIGRGPQAGLFAFSQGVLALVLALLLLCNLFEKGLWTYVNLDGRCPVCKTWRFGRIRRPQTLKCGHCTATLEFVRSDASQP